MLKFKPVFEVLLICSLYLWAASVFTSMAVLSIVQVLIIITSIFWAIHQFRDGELKITKSQVALMAFLLIAIVSLLVNGGPSQLILEVGALGRILLALIWVYGLRAFVARKNEKHIHFIIWTFIIGTSLAHISGAVGLWTGWNPLKFRAASDLTRSTGLFGMAVTYGYGCQFLLLIFLGLFLARNQLRTWSRNINFLWPTALTTIGLILSFTRGGYLGALAGLPFLFKKFSSRAMKWAIGVFMGLLLGVFASMAFAPQTSRFHFQSESNRIRISQYKTVWYGFKEKPWMGHGFRQFSAQVGRLKEAHNLEFKSFVGNAHNNFLEVLACTGILGLFAFVAFLFFWLREIVSSHHFLAPICLAVWVAFLVSGQFQATFMDAENLYLLFFVYSISLLITPREILLGRPAQQKKAAQF